jgi:sec-independent protein translocase protein TatC
MLTPPDALSQCMMAVPMYLLYEGGILMARFLAKSRGAGTDGAKDPDKAEA